MSPVDHYYAVLDSYCKWANLNHMNNDHPMAKHFAVLFALARAAEEEE
jgi:hypothetical protein